MRVVEILFLAFAITTSFFWVIGFIAECKEKKNNQSSSTGVQANDAVVLRPVLHHLLAALGFAELDFSVLANQAADTFYLWTQFLNLPGCLGPHKEVFVATRQVDAIGILMPAVDAILTPGVITHQDDKHQRHHQARYINKGV